MTQSTITFTFDGNTVTGVLPPSAAAASLVAQLPLELSFTDFGVQEKLASLTTPLTLDGMPAGSGATPGMIGYYAPDQVLVLYYDTVGYHAGIVPLGAFDDVALVRDSGPFTATITQ